MRDLIKSILKTQVNYIYQVTFMYYFINFSDEELLWKSISLRRLKWVYSLLSFICLHYGDIKGYSWGRGPVLLKAAQTWKERLVTFWKTSNLNQLAGFVHAEIRALVACVAPAGWWFSQCWGITSQPGCLYRFWDVWASPGHPAPFPTVLVLAGVGVLPAVLPGWTV